MLSRCLVTFTLLGLLANSASADILAFTDPTAFATAISGRTSTTIDFESAAVGDTIADGASFDGLTFDYAWGSGESLRINDDSSTNSGTQYLGATSAGFGADLQTDFNDFDITVDTPASGLGMFIIAPFEPFEGEIVLSAGGVMAELPDTALGTLGDGSFVYFLGLAGDETDVLGTVALSGDGFSFVDFRVDDITFADAVVAVPEPTGLLLVSSSLMCCVLRRRRSS